MDSPARRKFTPGPVFLALVILGVVSATSFAVARRTAAVKACANRKGVLVLPTAKGACPRGSRVTMLGTKGPRGLAGPTGPAGAAGQAGPKGDAGPAGAKGAPGAEGPTGPKGADGDRGPEGPTGPKGADGDRGPEGPTGPKGANGDQGPTGPKGADGDQGPTGPKGADGGQGPTGDQGIQGPSGPTGPRGAQGDTGPTGANGFRGPTGPQGPAGPLGIVAASNLGFSTDDRAGWVHTEDLADDACLFNIPLGFTYTGFGRSISSVSLSSNGILFLGQACSIALTNTALPSAISGDPFLAFFWDDLKDFGTGEFAEYATLGSPGGRVFNLFFRMRLFSSACGSDQVTAMVSLYEQSNLVNVYYPLVTGCSAIRGSGATLGLQGPGGASAQAYNLGTDAAVIDDNRQQSLSFQPPPN